MNTIKLMFTQISRLLFVAAMVAIAPIATNSVCDGFLNAGVAVANDKKKRNYPTIRARVFAQLERAQKLADEKQVEEGLKVLNDLERRADQLNSYEKAMVFNFKAYIYYAEEKIAEAIDSFEKVVVQGAIPKNLEQSTLFALAQLHMQTQNYDKSIETINKWASLTEEGKNIQSENLLANAYYAKKDYARSLEHIDESIELTEEAEKVPAQGALILKRALHYELKQTEEVVEVSEDLVRYYSKPKYWIELANMYGEVGAEQKQLAVMEAAYQQGFVTKELDLKNLAQLYYLNGAPFKAAALTEKALNEGKMQDTLKNLEFLAQAWTIAKEYDKAIPILEKAATKATNGDIYGRLAEVYVNMEKWELAVEAGEKALAKGELKAEESVHIALGMALFNLKQYDQSTRQFAAAQNSDKYGRMASQWLSYVSKEKDRREQLLLELGDEINNL